MKAHGLTYQTAIRDGEFSKLNMRTSVRRPCILKSVALFNFRDERLSIVCTIFGKRQRYQLRLRTETGLDVVECFVHGCPRLQADISVRSDKVPACVVGE